MTFQDLPGNLAQRALTEDRLVANVLDLLVSPTDRLRGCLLFALCDADARLVQPCIVHDVPDATTGDDMRQMTDVFVGVLVEASPPGSLLVGIGRETGLSATDADQAWATAIEQACADRIRLLGIHIVTQEGSRPVPGSSAAA